MTALTLALATVWIAGCGVGGNEESDEVGRARLDRVASTIIMPLDEYDISDAGWATISRARELAFANCMAKLGVIDANPPESLLSEDRDYGLWNVERARLYGFGSVPADEAPAASEEPPGVYRELDPAWVEARSSCIGSLASEVEPFTPPDEIAARPATFQVKIEAHKLAEKDPQWKAHRDEWWQCLKNVGLIAPPEEDAWSSQQTRDLTRSMADPNNPSPAEKEEEIRIAVKEATCNEETALTQKLGDIEAGYQVPLIKGKQAMLNEQKSKNLEYVAKAEKYLATHQ
ncbi:hypothetical protein ACQCSU_21615 (plasmid) [Pseudarthrobacter sp. O4]|uniref:hypothetical protein n=1 Tax=Pseudarthrobacter sp. O4 TaxID=3418417 RepID=UPI003CF1D816